MHAKNQTKKPQKFPSKHKKMPYSNDKNVVLQSISVKLVFLVETFHIWTPVDSRVFSVSS